MPGTTRDKRPAPRPEGPGHSTWARLFGSGEDPLAWSFPIARLGGVRLRMHWVFPLWFAAELVAWLPLESLGLVHVLAVTLALLLIVPMRELTRLACARSLGGEADAVALWPLGGLSPVSLSGAGRPVLAESAGLLANLALVPVTALLVRASGLEWSALLFDPLNPRVLAATLRTNAQVLAWWAFYANAIGLALNLLPMACFDAGRVLTAVLRRRSGLAGGAAAARIGLVVAAALLVLSASSGQTRLALVAAFAALATFLEFRRADFILGPLAEESVAVRLHAPGREADSAPPPPAPPDLDSILAKISRTGLVSLTDQERAVLAHETRRRRHPG